MTTWMNNAACRDIDPDLFFPVPRSGPAYDKQVEQAQAVCDRCTVRPQCTIFADSTNTEHGVWGRETQAQRRARHRSPAPTG